jgi:hypothetical protein
VVTAPFSAFLHALTTPTLRYYEQLHEALKQKAKARDYREEAQITQLEELYTKTKS